MFKSKHPKFEVTIVREALTSIFDECDQFDYDETGGRIIGTYSKKGNNYEVRVLGVLGPGPRARRTPTSFFQDGEYQERLFRSIEKQNNDIEHLGNWHTHHVNGLQTLSSGDLTTYRATVNHQNHNTDFFYALLVTRKTSDRDRRYEVKHYFFRRNDGVVHEVPDRQVKVVDTPAVWSRDMENTPEVRESQNEMGAGHPVNNERGKDADLFAAFYSGLKPLFSKRLDAIYWKGPLTLIDGSHIDVVAIEVAKNGKAFYTITAVPENRAIVEIVDRYRDRKFDSARHAVLTLERDVNRAVFTAVLRSN